MQSINAVATEKHNVEKYTPVDLWGNKNVKSRRGGSTCLPVFWMRIRLKVENDFDCYKYSNVRRILDPSMIYIARHSAVSSAVSRGIC